MTNQLSDNRCQISENLAKGDGLVRERKFTVYPYYSPLIIDTILEICSSV